MWQYQILEHEFFYIFYNFILYSFLGWIYESCLVSFQHKEWVNRGFLNGPVIPIYGCGATVILLFLAPISNNYVLVFLAGMVLATILEYLVSFLMEKLFHTEWWDYSDQKWNFQGRVCFLASLLWGILSVSLFAIFQPGMDTIINKIPRETGEYIGYAIIVVFLADLIITIISTINLDKKLAELQKIKTDFIEYIAKTRFYEFTEEWRMKISQFKLQELKDKIIEKFTLEEEKKTEDSLTRKPLAETPVSEKVLAETSVSEKVLAETPVSEKVLAETPVSEKVLAETPVSEKVLAETPVSEKVLAETSVSEKVLAETPVSEKVLAETSVSEKVLAENSLLEETEDPFQVFQEKYQEKLKKVRIIQKRLLKAFPDMKSTKNNAALSDMKEELKKERNSK